jgi:hypothetical protein
MPIEDKKKVLKQLRQECMKNYKEYSERYRRLKRKDNITDGVCSVLNCGTIVCIVNTPVVPPLFIPSAVCSGLQFIISRYTEKMRWKDKYNQYLTTANQYYALNKEILVVLHKNHLTNEQYGDYISEITDKLNLVRDTQLL